MKKFAIRIINGKNIKIDTMEGTNAREVEQYWKARGENKVLANRIWDKEGLRAICEGAKKEYAEVTLTPPVTLAIL